MSTPLHPKPATLSGEIPPGSHDHLREFESVPVAALYKDLALHIEHVPLTSLREYSRNSRTHSKKQIEQIGSSITAFGFVQPLIVDEKGEIIGGHGLLAAAKRLNYTEVPVIRLRHLDEPQRRALRIALNRSAELAGWDHDLLALEFKELLDFDLTLDLSFDLAVTGFSAPEIDRVLAGAQGSDPSHDDAPAALDPESPPTARPGDLFHLGPHRLLCGDARRSENFAVLLGGEQAAMGIHDAPYNVKITGHVSRSGRHREFMMGVGELSETEFTAFLTDVLCNAAAVTHPGGSQFAFMDWRHMREMLNAGQAAGLLLKNLCIWNKGSGAMGSLYRSQHELVFVFADPRAPVLNNVQLGKHGRNRTNVWDFPGAASLKKELALHPTPKPVALIAEAIRDCSNRNDIVLDAFSGSGTTIMAAASCGRRGYAMELDPHYVDVAVRRWEAWSGEEARHAETGLTFAELRRGRTVDALKDSAQQAAAPAADKGAHHREIRVRRRPQLAPVQE